MKETLPNTIVAFDGLSLSGKSTMVAMLKERSQNAMVVRENILDPYRPTTAMLNNLLKGSQPYQAVRQLEQNVSEQHRLVLNKALDYAAAFQDSDRKQAILAYMFAAGRQVVDRYVRETIGKQDLILDRWQITGWAYQAGERYSWQEIRKLNQEFGIILPHVEIVLTCPIDQIPQRREFREKFRVGTAGQMSLGREGIILQVFWAIFRQMKKEEMQIYLIEN